MNKQFYTITAIVLIILGLSFYWFEYRPKQIKKNCYNQAQQDYVSPSYATAVGKTEMEVKNDYYNSCIMSKGIK